jgi:hypothetical protein
MKVSRAVGEVVGVEDVDVEVGVNGDVGVIVGKLLV